MKHIVLVSLVLLCGCANQEDVSKLTGRIESMEKEVQSINTRLETVESLQRVETLLKGSDGIAYLTPGSEGYSVINTDLGNITISLENIQPYANGSRVSLKFGNLLNAAITGAEATVEWGSVDEKGSPMNDAAHSRKINLNDLRAGAWATVPVILEGLPPTELGFVRVKDITSVRIGLNR